MKYWLIQKTTINGFIKGMKVKGAHMDKGYSDFISRMNQMIGIDLSLYKEAQMKRRITSLRNKRGFENFSSYFQALKKDQILLDEFIDRLTINVSEFYRNPKRWEVLQEKVIPHLIHDKDKLTIWSAACSTGEEPYSLAIMLKERFPSLQVQILATDIDKGALDKAKQGVYKEQSLKDLPHIYKNKYFIQKNGLCYLNEKIKKMVNFKGHNLLADRYPQNIDLIICRNVLIYFTDEAKQEIYTNFSHSLNPDGVLFVGSTEQIFSPDQYNLSVFDTFFYKKEPQNE